MGIIAYLIGCLLWFALGVVGGGVVITVSLAFLINNKEQYPNTYKKFQQLRDLINQYDK